jgi:hypothetical protein
VTLIGFQRTIFEGDSLNVVNALCMEGSCWNRFGQLIEDTKERLSSLHSAKVRHTLREANQAAHILAKFALSTSIDRV